MVIIYPVFRFLRPPEIPEATTNQVSAGRIDDPQLLEKGFKIVHFGAEPVILLKISDNEYRAFTATCTHLACTVEYRRDKHLIWCNCHNGSYDLTGKNVGGPPPRPLTPYKVNLVESSKGPSEIVVSRA